MRFSKAHHYFPKSVFSLNIYHTVLKNQCLQWCCFTKWVFHVEMRASNPITIYLNIPLWIPEPEGHRRQCKFLWQNPKHTQSYQEQNKKSNGKLFAHIENHCYKKKSPLSMSVKTRHFHILHSIRSGLKASNI